MNDILVFRVEDHKKHKKVLLNLISSLISDYGDSFLTDVEGGPKVFSDWNLPKELERPYLQYFYDIIGPAMDNVAQSIGLESYDWTIENGWFHQYPKLGRYPWHNHPKSHFTNCYYLELPDDSYKTEIKGRDGKLIKFEAKEGDIMTCPAWMIHRSKPNGINRKTVISFNSNYWNRSDKEHNV